MSTQEFVKATPSSGCLIPAVFAHNWGRIDYAPALVGAKASQRDRSGRDPRSAGRQRLGLILFGALFVLLFLGIAASQGISDPSVPSGDVAHITEVPDEISNISEKELERSILRLAGQKAPKPGTEKYEELEEKALTELIEGVWLRGQAEELGLSVTKGQVEKELDNIKKERFPTPAAYKKFLEKAEFSQGEVNKLVELQILSTEIQQKVTEEAPKPDAAKIEEYYEEEKASQFTEKESRDVRVVVNPDKAKAEAAKAALLKDNSPAGWKKAAEKYSSDPTTASKGGLQPGIQEEFLPEPLKRPIFDAATNEVIGPVKVEQNYFVLEVDKLNPAKAKSLKEAEAEIVGTLEQEEQQAYLGEFITDYQSKWESRTFCADGFEIKLCANFKGSGRPENAPPACYEEDPEVPATECPAPVTFNRPALPGTITPQQPEGEAFVQRPHPEAADAAGEQGTVVPGGGAPEGAAPEGAAPEGEAPPEAGGEAPPTGE